jgi:hypothetical protein
MTTFEEVLNLPALRPFAWGGTVGQARLLRIETDTPRAIYGALLQRIEASPELYLLCRIAVNSAKYETTQDVRQGRTYEKRCAKVRAFVDAWRAELLAALSAWFEFDEAQHAECRRRLQASTQKYIDDGREKAQRNIRERRTDQRNDQIALRRRAEADARARDETAALKRARAESRQQT